MTGHEDSDKELDLEVAGQKLRTKGYRIQDLTNLLLVAMLALIGYTLWEHKSEAREDSVRHRALMEKQAEVQAEMNYIISLPIEEREKLNLGMPPSLRAKQRIYYEYLLK